MVGTAFSSETVLGMPGRGGHGEPPVQGFSLLQAARLRHYRLQTCCAAGAGEVGEPAFYKHAAPTGAGWYQVISLSSPGQSRSNSALMPPESRKAEYALALNRCSLARMVFFAYASLLAFTLAICSSTAALTAVISAILASRLLNSASSISRVTVPWSSSMPKGLSR